MSEIEKARSRCGIGIRAGNLTNSILGNLTENDMKLQFSDRNLV